MEYITLAVGLIVGVLIGTLLSRAHTMGALRIDNSDPDGPYLFVELSRGVHDISRMKTVKFTVKVENFIPRK